jgi:rod shape-determining protein MreD
MQRLDRLARQMTPVALSFLVVVLTAMPLSVPNYGPIAPNLGIAATFYWVVYRPDVYPPWASFAIGLWEDILSGAPVGLNALLLVLVHWAIISQRRFFQGKSFFVIWWAFAMTAGTVAMVAWVLTMLLNGVAVSPLPAVFQFGLTAAIYPFVTWMFARAQHAVLRS